MFMCLCVCVCVFGQYKSVYISFLFCRVHPLTFLMVLKSFSTKAVTVSFTFAIAVAIGPLDILP